MRCESEDESGTSECSWSSDSGEEDELFESDDRSGIGELCELVKVWTVAPYVEPPVVAATVRRAGRRAACRKSLLKLHLRVGEP